MTYKIIHLSFRDVNAILPGHSHMTPALMTLSRLVLSLNDFIHLAYME